MWTNYNCQLMMQSKIIHLYLSVMKCRESWGHLLFYCSGNLDIGYFAIPKPSSKLKAKRGKALLSVSARRRRSTPTAAATRRSYLNSGLSSLTRGFQGRPGASKPEAPRDFKFEMPIPGPWPWPCPKPLKLYSKLKPGNGTALSDFYYYYYYITHF